ncbi:MAG: LuxR C-terminal-related transcriptional regulator [Gemmatimonadales bacterium]
MAQQPTRTEGSHPARTLIVDDHPITRRGLADVIKHTQDLVVCGETDLVSVTRDVVERLEPDVAVVNLSSKLADALSVIRRLTKLSPVLPAVALSIYNTAFDAEQALRAGARGFVVGWQAPETLLMAVRHVLAGGVYLCPEAQAQLVGKLILGEGGGGVEGLTKRESEVLRLIGLGLSTREVAQELKLSSKTVETYRRHIKTKLKLENMTQVIRYAALWVSGETF